MVRNNWTFQMIEYWNYINMWTWNQSLVFPGKFSGSAEHPCSMSQTWIQDLVLLPPSPSPSLGPSQPLPSASPPYSQDWCESCAGCFHVVWDAGEENLKLCQPSSASLERGRDSDCDRVRYSWIQNVKHSNTCKASIYSTFDITFVVRILLIWEFRIFSLSLMQSLGDFHINKCNFFDM